MYEEQLKYARSIRLSSIVISLVIYAVVSLTFPPEGVIQVSIALIISLVAFQIMSAFMIKHSKENLAKFSEQMAQIADIIGPFNRSDVFEAEYGYDIFKDSQSYMVVLVNGEIDKIINVDNVKVIKD